MEKNLSEEYIFVCVCVCVCITDQLYCTPEPNRRRKKNKTQRCIQVKEGFVLPSLTHGKVCKICMSTILC